MGAGTTKRGQHTMNTVMVEMTLMVKRLMTMVLQTKNKDNFIYVILSDSLIPKFIIK